MVVNLNGGAQKMEDWRTMAGRECGTDVGHKGGVGESYWWAVGGEKLTTRNSRKGCYEVS